MWKDWYGKPGVPRTPGENGSARCLVSTSGTQTAAIEPNLYYWSKLGFWPFETCIGHIEIVVVKLWTYRKSSQDAFDRQPFESWIETAFLDEQFLDDFESSLSLHLWWLQIGRGHHHRHNRVLNLQFKLNPDRLIVTRIIPLAPSWTVATSESWYHRCIMTT